MNRLEEDFFHSLPLYVCKIAKQLKLMNKLKCIELKAEYPDLTSQIDNIEGQIES